MRAENNMKTLLKIKEVRISSRSDTAGAKPSKVLKEIPAHRSMLSSGLNLKSPEL